jgi:hypothetical protein
MKKFSFSLISVFVILSLIGLNPSQVQAQSDDFESYTAVIL